VVVAAEVAAAAVAEVAAGSVVAAVLGSVAAEAAAAAVAVASGSVAARDARLAWPARLAGVAAPRGERAACAKSTKSAVGMVGGSLPVQPTNSVSATHFAKVQKSCLPTADTYCLRSITRIEADWLPACVVSTTST
jgi:hypothetical protein